MQDGNLIYPRFSAATKKFPLKVLPSYQVGLSQSRQFRSGAVCYSFSALYANHLFISIALPVNGFPVPGTLVRQLLIFPRKFTKGRAPMKNRKQIENFVSPRNSSLVSHLREISVTYEGQNEGISLRTPDISTQGMFISTAMRFPEGAVITLRFRLTRTNVEIAARSEVCYCLGGLGIGVKFLDLSMQSAQAIEKELHLAQQDGSLPA